MAQTIFRSPSQLSRKRASRTDYDSPSKQLLRDLDRALQQIQLHETEEHKVRAYQRRSWYGQLDEFDQEKAKQDFAAIDAATARHNAVRQEAEKELQEYYRQLEEAERQKREEEERLLREKQARETAERERREKEEAARQEAARKVKEEAERKAAEAKAKAEAEERKRKEREDTVAREKAEKAEKERRAEEEAAESDAKRKAAEEKARKEAEEKARQALPRSNATSAVQPSVNPSAESQHRRYLEIHQSLKQFRHSFWDECKKHKELKSKIGDIRRTIRISVGQLVDPAKSDTSANKKPHNNVKTALLGTLSIQTPPVDLNTFLATPLDNSPQISAGLLYAMNIFSKLIISQLSNESGVNTKAAEPAGVLVASIFATPDFQFNGTISLIDVLIAKYHVVCPVLFGINGPESTVPGKLRLGWRRENGSFVSENRHAERMAGLGAGYAAIALRNFSKSKNKNPYPPDHYWIAFSNILNIPPNEVQQTHLDVLRGMIENSTDRFVMFFNDFAMMALRSAMVEFPQSLPPNLRKTPACNSLMLLPEMLRRERGFDLS